MRHTIFGDFFDFHFEFYIHYLSSAQQCFSNWCSIHSIHSYHWFVQVLDFTVKELSSSEERKPLTSDLRVYGLWLSESCPAYAINALIGVLLLSKPLNKIIARASGMVMRGWGNFSCGWLCSIGPHLCWPTKWSSNRPVEVKPGYTLHTIAVLFIISILRYLYPRSANWS